MNERKYGVTDGFSLRSPRAVDEGPFDTLAEAFAEAARMAEDGGCERLRIVLCRFSERHECWVEIVGGSIAIDLYNAGALLAEAEEHA